MKRLTVHLLVLFFSSLSFTALLRPQIVLAHCDSIDGPVVKDAQRALEAKNIAPVLKWIAPKDEKTVTDAFTMVLAVRGESDAAQKVADQYFFDTLVRLHRASEGEGFEGLKPPGQVDPAIAAADRALVEGDVDTLAERLAAGVRDGVVRRFTEAHRKRQTAEKSVAQGREYVEAYVAFTHFVEGVDHLVTHGASHQHRDADAGSEAPHEKPADHKAHAHHAH